MNITHIEHIGIAVKSIEEACKYYEQFLGLKCYSVEEVKDQKVKTAFFMVGDTKIELLESTDPEVLLAGSLRKRARVFIILPLQLRILTMLCRKLRQKAFSLLTKLPVKALKVSILPFCIINQL